MSQRWYYIKFLHIKTDYNLFFMSTLLPLDFWNFKNVFLHKSYFLQHNYFTCRLPKNWFNKKCLWIISNPWQCVSLESTMYISQLILSWLEAVIWFSYSVLDLIMRFYKLHFVIYFDQLIQNNYFRHVLDIFWSYIEMSK